MSKRSKRRRRQKMREAQKRHQLRVEPVPEQCPQSLEAGEGVAVPMPMERKQDQRFAARLLSLGIVSEPESAAILKKAFQFAAGADKVRDYATAMRVVMTAAKLEQDAEIRQQAAANNYRVDNQLNVTIGDPDLYDLDRISRAADELGLRDVVDAITTKRTGLSAVVEGEVVTDDDDEQADG